MSDNNPEPGEFLADRHIDLDAGEFGMMADADYYDRIAAAPAKTPACALCDDTGIVWTDGCNCGVGERGDSRYGMHERHCGAEPCPAGCLVPETTSGGTP
jgi:hypothetical protein